MNERNKDVKVDEPLKSFNCTCREGFSGARCEYADGSILDNFFDNLQNRK